MIFKTFDQFYCKKKYAGASLKPEGIKKTIKELKAGGYEHIHIVAWRNNEDLSFLSGHDWIKSLWITNCELLDTAPLNTLSNLENLTFYNNKVKGTIDLSQFPNLKRLEIAHSEKRYINFAKAVSLQELELYHWPYADINGLLHLINLENLRLNFAKKLITLSGINRLNNMEDLYIYSANKLEDIADITGLGATLKKLQFEKVRRIKDFSALEDLIHLERFYIYESSPLHSIQWMKKLHKLRSVYVGTEVLDKNVTYLIEKGFDYKKVKAYKT